MGRPEDPCVDSKKRLHQEYLALGSLQKNRHRGRRRPSEMWLFMALQEHGGGQPEPTHECGRLGQLLRVLWRCPGFWGSEYPRTGLVPIHIHSLPLFIR